MYMHMHSYRIKGRRAWSFMLPFLVGIYTEDEDKDDQRLCVVEHKVIRCLCQGLVLQHCCRPRPTWQLESFMKVHYINPSMLVVF